MHLPPRAAARLVLALILFAPVLVGAAGTDALRVDLVNETASARLNARNRGPVPVQVRLWMTEMNNVVTDRIPPIDRVVAPFKSVDLLQVRPGDPRATYSYRYQYRTQIGDPDARPARDVVYRAPFENGLAFRIGQAFGGPLPTHDHDHSRYAVDIPMPVGTVIVAARGGYIVDVQRQYDSGGFDPEYISKANVVTIFHDDGSFATYAHLLRYTSNVVPGQHIDAGVPIGLSGNSGFSSGPHLHFVVQRNSRTGILSLPFRFESPSRGAFVPRSGDVLEAGPTASQASRPRRDSIVISDAAVASPKSHRTLRECMGGKSEIDRKVLDCAGIR